MDHFRSFYEVWLRGKVLMRRTVSQRVFDHRERRLGLKHIQAQVLLPGVGGTSVIFW